MWPAAPEVPKGQDQLGWPAPWPSRGPLQLAEQASLPGLPGRLLRGHTLPPWAGGFAQV